MFDSPPREIGHTDTTVHYISRFRGSRTCKSGPKEHQLFSEHIGCVSKRCEGFVSQIHALDT